MATHELRAMSVGEILDGAFTLYRNHFGPLIAISIVCLGVPTLLNVFIELGGGMLANPGLWAITALLASLGWLPATAATVWLVSEAYLGRDPELGSALRFGLRKIWKLLVAGIAAYLIVGLALLALVIPGIVVACGYSVVVQAVVLEDLRAGTDALGRSWALTKGHKGKAFRLGLAVFVLFVLPSMAAGVVAAMIPESEAVFAALAQVLSFLVTPWFACVLTLFYYDLRVRQEAFDLVLLNRTLETAIPAPA